MTAPSPSNETKTSVQTRRGFALVRGEPLLQLLIRIRPTTLGSLKEFKQPLGLRFFRRLCLSWRLNTTYKHPQRATSSLGHFRVHVQLGRCKAGRRLSLRCFAHEEHLLHLLFPLTWIEISEGQSNK